MDAVLRQKTTRTLITVVALTMVLVVLLCTFHVSAMSVERVFGSICHVAVAFVGYTGTDAAWMMLVFGLLLAMVFSRSSAYRSWFSENTRLATLRAQGVREILRFGQGTGIYERAIVSPLA